MTDRQSDYRFEKLLSKTIDCFFNALRHRLRETALETIGKKKESQEKINLRLICRFDRRWMIMVDAAFLLRTQSVDLIALSIEGNRQKWLSWIPREDARLTIRLLVRSNLLFSFDPEGQYLTASREIPVWTSSDNTSSAF